MENNDSASAFLVLGGVLMFIAGIGKYFGDGDIKGSLVSLTLGFIFFICFFYEKISKNNNEKSGD